MLVLLARSHYHGPIGPPLVILGVILVILFIAAYFSRDARIKRSIRQAPKYTIAEAPEWKLITIVGRLRYLAEPMVAPLSKRRCACYEVIVTQKRGKHWRQIIHDQQQSDFFIEDGTGLALVRLTGAQLVINKDSKLHSGTLDNPSTGLIGYLKEHNVESTTTFGFNKNLSYREGVFEDGESIAICGYARREPNPQGISASYRDQPTCLVFQAGGEEQPLYASDEGDVL